MNKGIQMIGNDDWGRDPAVQMMRRVFREMERTQRELLSRLGVSALDQRLRNWRRPARILFEKAWAEANRMGMSVTEKRAASIYLRCLANRMERDGVDIPDGALPSDPEIEKVVREVTA